MHERHLSEVSGHGFSSLNKWGTNLILFFVGETRKKIAKDHSGLLVYEFFIPCANLHIL